MLLPGKQESQPAPEPTVQVPGNTAQEQLQEILSRIDGAGQVSVLLSEREGSQTLYQTDTDGTDSKTVLVTDGQRSELGLVRRTDPPKYLGAVVVCQGADRAHVRLAIVEAVRCATGLGADQISVVKMKG